MITDLKYKLQKSEQEIASLQATLARSETQVIRYKAEAEAAEKAEADLKIEKRKLQREVSCFYSRNKTSFFSFLFFYKYFSAFGYRILGRMSLSIDIILSGIHFC